MEFRLPSHLEPYEITASMMIWQALKKQGHDILVSLEDNKDQDWLDIGGFMPGYTSLPVQTLDYGNAYRISNSSDKWYPEILAELSGLKVEITQLEVKAEDTGKEAIILTPFTNLALFDLAEAYWRLISEFLRTYELPVKTVGNPRQRIYAKYAECDILSDCSLKEKVAAIKAAKLIVGVPNEWMDIAVGLEKPLIVLYPDKVKQSRRFPYLTIDKPYRLMAYPKNGLEPSACIMGLRHLIANL